MHIHILGICGTFMSGIATLAKALGHQVTGQDRAALPPISTLLEAQEIPCTVSEEISDDLDRCDLVIVGNSLSRGKPVIEHMLTTKKPFVSGPEWLHQNVLKHKRCICITGTHGKTTTTAMIAHILQENGYQPGYLIAGDAHNFEHNAHLGEGEWFVIEGDEYDTAFFDKRPKFLHYFPEIAIINNLEFDHADIYRSLGEIQTQFHYLMRTIPSHGLVIYNNQPTIDQVIQRGCWSPTITTGSRQDHWYTGDHHPVYQQWEACRNGNTVAHVDWSLIGHHNAANALNALACAEHVGIDPSASADALNCFGGVKRRLEHIASLDGHEVYDDFAHHPTAIYHGLNSVKMLHPNNRLIVILELGCYTLRHGVMLQQLGRALDQANCVIVYGPDLKPDPNNSQENPTDLLQQNCHIPLKQADNLDQVLNHVKADLQPRSTIVLMSSRGLNILHEKLLTTLQAIPATYPPPFDPKY